MIMSLFKTSIASMMLTSLLSSSSSIKSVYALDESSVLSTLSDVDVEATKTEGDLYNQVDVSSESAIAKAIVNDESSLVSLNSSYQGYQPWKKPVCVWLNPCGWKRRGRGQVFKGICPKSTWITSIEVYKTRPEYSRRRWNPSYLGKLKITCSDGSKRDIGDNDNVDYVDKFTSNLGFDSLKTIIAGKSSGNDGKDNSSVEDAVIGFSFDRQYTCDRDNKFIKVELPTQRCPAGSKITGIKAMTKGRQWDCRDNSPIHQIKFKCCSFPGGKGDPSISGFLNQQFQVHGTSDAVYNFISSENLVFNTEFKFLDQGKCRIGTECFSHAGNYIGSAGLLIKGEDSSLTKVVVKSGPVSDGMSVNVNDVAITPSSTHIKIDEVNEIYFPNVFEVYIKTRDFSIRLDNSDMFLNQQVSIESPLMKLINEYKISKSQLKRQSLPHGILGQTWEYVEYDNKWKYIQGDLYDYIVADGLSGKQVKYSRFM